MPKISYNEIVSPDVHESSLLLHEWELDLESKTLAHYCTGRCVEIHTGIVALNEWNKLCRKK